MLSKSDIARARQAAGLWRAHFPPTLLYPTESLNPIKAAFDCTLAEKRELRNL